MILGMEIDNLGFDEAVDSIIGLAVARKRATVVTPNVDHVMRWRRDPEFRRCYEEADLVLADGMPLLWASRVLGDRIIEKVSGSDLLPRLCEAAAERGLSVYFLGGLPGAAERCAERLVARFPRLRVAGVGCPPRGFEHDPEANAGVIRAIVEAGPDLLFVGLGTPKQELWIRRHREEIAVPVTLGVGAAIDFAAGMVKRAPRWMQRLGLEWCYRLVKEPRRLWRRYILQDSPFLWHVLVHSVRRR